MSSDNPYAASDVSTAHDTATGGFESLVGLTTTITWVLGGALSLIVLIDVSDIAAYVLRPELLALDPYAELSDEAALFLGIQGGAGVLNLLALLAALPLWTTWHARAARNTERFGTPTDIAPGWHWGWWFVPFANLYMPYRALYRTYSASIPENQHLEGAHLDHPRVDPPGSMPLWWACYLIGNFVANAAFRMSMGEMAEMSLFVGWFATPFMVAALVLYLGYLRDISRMQHARFEDG